MVVVKTSATIEGLNVLDTLGDILKEAFGGEISKRLIENTEDAIQNEIFLSKLNTRITGIVDLGEYKKSFEIDKEQAPDVFLVGSANEHAYDLEFGTTADQHANLKDSTIIAWVKRKGFAGRRFIRVGQRIARFIRRHGIREKPALTRAIAVTKTDQEEIKNRTFEVLKEKLNR